MERDKEDKWTKRLQWTSPRNGVEKEEKKSEKLDKVSSLKKLANCTLEKCFFLFCTETLWTSLSVGKPLIVFIYCYRFDISPHATSISYFSSVFDTELEFTKRFSFILFCLVLFFFACKSARPFLFTVEVSSYFLCAKKKGNHHEMSHTRRRMKSWHNFHLRFGRFSQH